MNTLSASQMISFGVFWGVVSLALILLLVLSSREQGDPDVMGPIIVIGVCLAMTLGIFTYCMLEGYARW